jgi:hypothetical protein
LGNSAQCRPQSLRGWTASMTRIFGKSRFAIEASRRVRRSGNDGRCRRPGSILARKSRGVKASRKRSRGHLSPTRKGGKNREVPATSETPHPDEPSEQAPLVARRGQTSVVERALLGRTTRASYNRAPVPQAREGGCARSLAQDLLQTTRFYALRMGFDHS